MHVCALAWMPPRPLIFQNQNTIIMANAATGISVKLTLERQLRLSSSTLTPVRPTSGSFPLSKANPPRRAMLSLTPQSRPPGRNSRARPGRSPTAMVQAPRAMLALTSCRSADSRSRTRPLSWRRRCRHSFLRAPATDCWVWLLARSTR